MALSVARYGSVKNSNNINNNEETLSRSVRLSQTNRTTTYWLY